MDDRQDNYRDDDAPLPSEGLTVETLDQIEPFETTTSDEPSEQTRKRREQLALYLDQLEDARRSGGNLRDAFNGIELDGWELSQLEAGLSDEVNRWQSLIAEGVAFRNKYETDLGWAPKDESPSYGEIADFRRLLITDTALGLALLEETQQAVNQLILSGEVDEAKHLTTFRNKIGQSVKELKTRVGDDAYSKAEGMGEEFVTPSELAAWAAAKSGSHFKPNSGRRRGRRQSNWPLGAGKPVEFKKDDEEKNSRVKPLLIVLAVLVVIWFAFVLPRQGVGTLPKLTVSEVSPRAEIRQVVAKPPSLFVELDSQGWSALSKPERLALVEDVGKTAMAAGYSGAQFKLENGRTAAQWFRDRGSELVE